MSDPGFVPPSPGPGGFVPPDGYVAPAAYPTGAPPQNYPLYAWDPQAQGGYVHNGVYYPPGTGPAATSPHVPSPVGFTADGVYHPPGTIPSAVPTVTAGYGYSPGSAPPVRKTMRSRDKILITLAIVTYVIVTIGGVVLAIANSAPFNGTP